MNALFQGAVDMGQIDKAEAIEEINALVKWQEERKKWHQDKTRQKMAAEGSGGSGAVESAPGATTFRSSDFGLNEVFLHPSFAGFSFPANLANPVYHKVRSSRPQLLLLRDRGRGLRRRKPRSDIRRAETPSEETGSFEEECGRAGEAADF